MPSRARVNHIATLTTDLDRHADFYQRVCRGRDHLPDGGHAGPSPAMFILDMGRLRTQRLRGHAWRHDRRAALAEAAGCRSTTSADRGRVAGRARRREAAPDRGGAPTSARSSASVTSGRCSSARCGRHGAGGLRARRRVTRGVRGSEALLPDRPLGVGEVRGTRGAEVRHQRVDPWWADSIGSCRLDTDWKAWSSCARSVVSMRTLNSLPSPSPSLRRSSRHDSMRPSRCNNPR